MDGKIITVFGNKGGVGKTFTAINLAATLTQAQKKVLLVELNLYGVQDVARMINLVPRQAITNFLADITRRKGGIKVSEYSNFHQTGIAYIPAVLNTQELGQVTPENITTFLNQASEEYDFVVIDGGSNFNEIMVSVFDHSNLILLVATPDILAVYQTQVCLEVFQNLHYPSKMIKLVLNRSESHGSVSWQDVQQALSCDIFARVPSDGKAVVTSLNRGIPCVIDSPRSRVTTAFKKLADVLMEEDVYVEATEQAKVRKEADIKERPNVFWEKFGITPHTLPTDEYTGAQEGDAITQLKRRIHEKLIKRMDLGEIGPEALANPDRMKKIKKDAEGLISELMEEESGALISSHELRKDLVKEIINEALGLGPLEDLLADPEITDIMVNSKDEIYIEKHGKIVLTNKKFVSEGQMRATIDRIVAPLGRRIDESVPMVDARLPDGSRFNAVIRPLSLTGPMITIRKFSRERYTIDDLLERFHSLNKPIADFLRACVLARKNIIVSGGTGAGKTTLLNIVSLFIPEDERVVTIEDAAELRLRPNSHWGRLESRPANVEGKGAVSIRDLFTNSLRMRPDRIIIGECRGAEVLDMLQAMNTGHDGSLTTLHANSTRDALIRLSSMMLLAGVDLPLRAMYEMIGTAIDIIVHVARFRDGSRRITGVTEVVGMIHEENQLDLRDVFIFDQHGIDEDGKVLGEFKPTGYIPQCYEEIVSQGIPLDKSIFTAPNSS